ncbi:uncharacterized protein LOC120392483 [Mauremys reevesii]|uniref:uncharacterized protein LOC120392483 n=1 Tax=Mauremys reevesii TaxID=260615 RepID=UPI00193FAC0E|nr:uncharacterized protein LOC120392483 [Mauremys reevesii]
MRPQLLPLALALLAALPPGAQAGRNHSALVFAGPEVTAVAGSRVNLSCTLTGPRLSWLWVPRYPLCAGGSSGIQTIYTVTAAGEHDAPEGRFQKRLRLLTSWGNQPSILELRPLHMNDSGAFFCASPSQEAPLISVTVTPGCPAGASITAVPQGPVVEGAFLSLSCSPCGAQGPTSPPAGGDMWRLNGKSPPDPTALRILRAKVTIEGFSSRFEGLWSCHLPGDPPRSGGYCLERHPGAHGTQESPPPGPSPVSPGPNPTSLLALVGGCAGAALGLVLVGIVAVICCRRRRARAARVTEMDRKSERAAEQPGPPAPARAEQKPPSPDPHPDGEGPEGISYSTVHFQAPRGAGARVETSPATIYSELATGHG